MTEESLETDSTEPRSTKKGRAAVLARARAGRRASLAACVFVGALAVAGCGSTPPTRVHSLLGPEAVTRGDASLSKSGGAFILEAIRLPASVDQPQWLVRLPDETLASLESERWASPLRDEFRQALIVELVGRFGLVDARDDRSFSSTAWRVRIDVMRFESIVGREARIEGSWTLTAPTTTTPTPATLSTIAQPPNPTPPSVHCTWRFAQQVGAGMHAMASAHRHNVMALSDAIGQALVRLQRGEPSGCTGNG